MAALDGSDTATLSVLDYVGLGLYIYVYSFGFSVVSLHGGLPVC